MKVYNTSTRTCCAVTDASYYLGITGIHFDTVIQPTGIPSTSYFSHYLNGESIYRTNRVVTELFSRLTLRSEWHKGCL